jgi:ubiquitin-protein ligase
MMDIWEGALYFVQLMTPLSFPVSPPEGRLQSMVVQQNLDQFRVIEASHVLVADVFAWALSV